MVKSRRKLLVMVPAWLPCLKMTDISRELYKVSRFVAAFLLLIVFFYKICSKLSFTNICKFTISGHLIEIEPALRFLSMFVFCLEIKLGVTHACLGAVLLV